MDKRQKSTLRSLHIKIADDLMPNEDFYAALLRDKIFTNEMLDSIKAEGTPRESVYKILELLEKRGPEAFDNFVWILKENFEWLAKELEGPHNRKLQRRQQGMESKEQNQQIQKKQYKDTCTSPIGIIESPRKTIHDMASPTYKQRHTKDDTQSVMDSYNQGFNDSPSQTATVTTSTNDDVESLLQITRTPEVQSEGFEKVSGTIVADDVPVSDGLEESDDGSPTREASFLSIREGSSQLSHINDEVFHHELSIPDDENNATRSEISYQQSKAFQYQKMREFFTKLYAITSENDDTEDLEDDFVNWIRIHTETDKLINRLEDDTKIIRKCYELFPEKERKQPLNACIERLFANKKELENRLGEKQKEIIQMDFDSWKHQQDIKSNIKELKDILACKEIEINNLKTSLENLEKDADIKLKQMEEKIKELESRHLEQPDDLQRKPGATARRGQYNLRRVSNTQGQSPRRQSSFGEPRMSLMQGACVQQYPRNMTTAMRKAPSNRK